MSTEYSSDLQRSGLRLDTIVTINRALAQDVENLDAERAWAVKNHRDVWEQYKLVNDAIRYKFWKPIRTTDLGETLKSASMEVLREWKRVLGETLEALARRINAVDAVLADLGRQVLGQRAPPPAAIWSELRRVERGEVVGHV